MERSEYLVEPPPPPTRKVRRTRITARERGIDVICRNGEFVMPSAALANSPLVVGLCGLSIQVYNQTADAMAMKRSVETVLEGSEGAMRLVLQWVCADLTRLIRRLRKLGHGYRSHVLDVEDGRPVNEPLSWARD